ncbi:hypothetical protein GDO81_019252 [Engystomops pustulosus]|uniref:Uncharacterized protein n=1 Tax=Engystomops pustulosus TaxID=76066 RepID=A0AAV6YZP9_ENGPU|nr:hypothetical protein GDO81_019252 [Engystomops pustulosus]
MTYIAGHKAAFQDCESLLRLARKRGVACENGAWPCTNKVCAPKILLTPQNFVLIFWCKLSQLKGGAEYD